MMHGYYSSNCSLRWGGFLGDWSMLEPHFLKMIQIHLHCFHFSDITKNVVVAARESASVCACVRTKPYTSVVVCYFWKSHLLPSFPQEMENGLLFLKLALRSDSLMQLFSVFRVSLWLLQQLLGFCSTIANNRPKVSWHLKNQDSVKMLNICRLLDFALKKYWCSSVWQHRRNCGAVRTDLVLCFLCRHVGVNGCATSPFTLLLEVKHSTPHREAFVLWMHSTSGMGTHYQQECMRGLPAFRGSSSGTGSVDRGSGLIVQCYLSV